MRKSISSLVDTFCEVCYFAIKEMEHNSIITFLTDFGTKDPYVGIMKGVVLGITPNCHLIDLTHQVRPQNILQASYLLSVSYPYFPKGTFFVCVIDPGVGTQRKAVLVKAEGYHFIGPDNGLFGFLNNTPPKTIVHLQNEKYFMRPVSKTFHGRDIFAPVAAHLATKGEKIIPDLGPTLTHLVEIERFNPIEKPDSIEGTIVHIDRFGNLISNIHSRFLKGLTPSDMTIRFMRDDIPLVTTFAEAPEGVPGALIGSSSHLEIFVRNGSAEKTLNAKIGEAIHVLKHHG